MTTTMNPPPTANTAPLIETHWLLEGCLPNQTGISRIAMHQFPFCIGRDAACDLQIASRSVSKRHAKILHNPAAVIVQDLSSTNGTFVNGGRISVPTPVGVNDLIQFADIEMRLAREVSQAAEFTCVAQQPEQSWLISRLNEVLNEGRMKVYFQPIVTGPDREIFGYEALVRTDVSGLESPLELFRAATRLGLSTRLSQNCRSEAVRAIEEAGVPGALFLNTEPNEVLGEELIRSMKDLRDLTNNRQLVLEIHEEAMQETKTLSKFAAALRDLGIQLAFDDFGAGQSRLLELAQILPDYLKFDRSLVKDLGTPGALHENLVRTLHETANSLGIKTLAEGLETAESIQACDTIGFDFHQGFAFGRPQPFRIS
ncbi:MAG: EAL domain-containing protein [Planctomycetaceae bacterium]|nr:EAL domain-containing protein [Planctomycetaceae bacterium]